MSEPRTNIARRVVAAAGAVDANYTQEETIDPATGGLNVSVAGSVPVTPTLRTQVIQPALATSHVLLAAPGTIYSARVQIDASAPGGVYYASLLNYATAQTAGVRNLLLAAIPVTHTAGVDDYITLPVGSGVAASVGAVVQLSSTLTPVANGPPATMTLTPVATPYLWLNSAEVG